MLGLNELDVLAAVLFARLVGPKTTSPRSAICVPAPIQR